MNLGGLTSGNSFIRVENRRTARAPEFHRFPQGFAIFPETHFAHEGIGLTSEDRIVSSGHYKVR